MHDGTQLSSEQILKESCHKFKRMNSKHTGGVWRGCGENDTNYEILTNNLHQYF